MGGPGPSQKEPVENPMLSNSLRAAVTGFAATLAREVARDGITVNTILPGYTNTERVTELNEANARREGVDPAEIQARLEAEIPLGRLADPEEFAALAAFLASERAGYITGGAFAVDGGWLRGPEARLGAGRRARPLGIGIAPPSTDGSVACRRA